MVAAWGPCPAAEGFWPHAQHHSQSDGQHGLAQPYLVIPEGLHDLGDVEQDGVLQGVGGGAVTSRERGVAPRFQFRRGPPRPGTALLLAQLKGHCPIVDRELRTGESPEDSQENGQRPETHGGCEKGETASPPHLQGGGGPSVFTAGACRGRG